MCALSYYYSYTSITSRIELSYLDDVLEKVFIPASGRKLETLLLLLSILSISKRNGEKVEERKGIFNRLIRFKFVFLVYLESKFIFSEKRGKDPT